MIMFLLKQTRFTFYNIKLINNINKVISYNFYTSSKFNDLYWYNIPTIIALNKIFYPDSEIRFYISPETKENPLYKILEHSSNKINSIFIEEIENYKYIKKTIWKNNNEIESISIIDSVTKDDIRSIIYFINKDRYNISRILNILNTNVDWIGEPVGFRRDILKRILEFDNYDTIKIIRDIIINDKELKDFYL